MRASLRSARLLRAQRGIILIDAMVAVVIFSIGVLGMVALQAAAIKLSSDTKYRSDAAMAAERIIAQMWASDPAALAADFKSPEGAAYKTWKDTVTRLTPQSGLPGASGKPPTIEVSADNVVTVTVYWRAPGDAGYHNYVSTTYVAR